MNKIVKSTRDDLKGFPYLLTRFNKQVNIPDDLDILVQSKDFDSIVTKLVKIGYQPTSHDQALGGRIPGAQINLTKPGRIKIDLHKDFTWRQKQYIDIQKIWENSRLSSVDPTWDAFLVMINVIFEKTYFTSEDFDIFFPRWFGIKNSLEFSNQASQYLWKNTFNLFKIWMEHQPKNPKFPLFLPVRLVLFSYFEKFNLVSLVYYLFFRTRFIVNGQLPYEAT